MASVVSVQKILDGPRNAIFKVDVSLDGTGDMSQTIIDPALLAPVAPYAGVLRRVALNTLDWSCQDGLTLNLFWDGAGPAPLWRMSGRGDVDFPSDVSNTADQPNGKITMTTSSQQTGVPLSASFKIRCIKKP